MRTLRPAYSGGGTVFQHGYGRMGVQGVSYGIRVASFGFQRCSSSGYCLGILMPSHDRAGPGEIAFIAFDSG